MSSDVAVVKLQSVPAVMAAPDRLERDIKDAPTLDIVNAAANLAAGLQRRWKPVKEVADRAGECWLAAETKLGKELAKDIDVTQKTAWFMMHRLRHAALTKSFNAPLTGEIEVDETYIGGKSINKHGRRSGVGGGSRGKTPVIGAMQRKGHLVTRVLNAAGSFTIQEFVRANVSHQATLLATDEHIAYRTLYDFPQRQMVKHSAGQYVSGRAHTNSIESVWALLKRQIFGIHHVVSPKHLHRYLGEMTWRYNRRADGEGSRLNSLLECTNGRLTYKGLIA